MGGKPRRIEGADPLATRLCEALRIVDTSELVSAVYREGFDRARIAALAPAVVRASADDPSILVEILEPAGADLARMGRGDRAVRSASTRAAGRSPLAMAGSFLLGCRAVAETLIDSLAGEGYDVQAAPVPDPSEGALILALRALGATG